MSSADKAALLASLRDIHEPAAPAPGWPWLITSILVGFVLLALLWKNRPRKATSIATQQIQAARTEQPSKALVRLARLLRANAASNALSSAAQVHGDSWLQALDAQFNTSFFTTDIGRVFGDNLYQKHTSDIDIATLCDRLQLLFDSTRAKDLT